MTAGAYLLLLLNYSCEIPPLLKEWNYVSLILSSVFFSFLSFGDGLLLVMCRLESPWSSFYYMLSSFQEYCISLLSLWKFSFIFSWLLWRLELRFKLLCCWLRFSGVSLWGFYHDYWCLSVLSVSFLWCLALGDLSLQAFHWFSQLTLSVMWLIIVSSLIHASRSSLILFSNFSLFEAILYHFGLYSFLFFFTPSWSLNIKVTDALNLTTMFQTKWKWYKNHSIKGTEGRYRLIPFVFHKNICVVEVQITESVISLGFLLGLFFWMSLSSCSHLLMKVWFYQKKKIIKKIIESALVSHFYWVHGSPWIINPIKLWLLIY